MSAQTPDAGTEGTYRDATPSDDADPERKWLEEVFQGESVAQLTVRATITGMLLGGVLVLSNLYVALKTGWAFGVTITAGILAFVIFRALRAVGLVKRHFGMLENNAMQSVASAAGYMTGGGTVAAIPALMMATHAVINGWVIFAWITTIAMMGVFMAIPMKRQMINQEGLKFPSGIAAAETLRGLFPAEAAAMDRRRRKEPAVEHTGEVDSPAGRALLWSGLAASFVMWLRDAKAPWMPFNLPGQVKFPFTIRGVAASKWSVLFDTSPLLVAAGAIMGWRQAWSMMLGAALNFLLLAPYGHDLGGFDEIKFKNIVSWTVWFGSPMLLTSGLLSFAFSWRQVARAFASVGKMFRASAGVVEDPLDRVEVPMRWFVWGMAALTPVVMYFAYAFFGIKWWMSLLCVAMSFFIAIVACRATGETDTTPTGALGKITQLVFGAVAPGSITTNLMCASMSGGVAIHSADMLTDLKSGYLLGAKPRQQFFAQFFGVLAGSVAVVPAFRLLVPDYSVLGTDAVPAPAAISWLKVAEVLSLGLDHLPVGARGLILAGSIVGVVMVLIERALPTRWRAWFPAVTGFGLAFTMPFANSLSMFLGAFIALVLERRKPDLAKAFLIPVSSGIIAGEGLMGIFIKVLERAHVLAG